MAQFTVRRSIDAPREQVWEILADYGNIASWSSGVAKSGIVGKRATGIGAVRQCDVMGGIRHHLLPGKRRHRRASGSDSMQAAQWL